MKNSHLILILILFFFQNIFAQDFQWVREFDGGPSYGTSDNYSGRRLENFEIEIDDNENTYTFGEITAPLFDLDPTSGTQIIDNTLQSTNPQCSLFLTKLDSDGNFIWGKTFGSFFGTRDKIIDIKIGSDGNIYLLADIHEWTTFYQKFITIFKVDSQGNILLVKKITNLDNPSQYDVYRSSSLALDSQNNIFITGSYRYHLMIDATNPQLNFNVGGDSFLLKMNTNGYIIFGKRFGLGFTNMHYESVTIDNMQNPILIVSTGDRQSVTNHGYNVYKINSNDGSIIWQKYLDGQNPLTFNIDKIGNIIIAGMSTQGYGNNIDVDPGPNTIYVGQSYYLLWLTNNGDFLDVKEYDVGTNHFYISEIEPDDNNNIFIVGGFDGVLDADPSNNSYLLNYACQFGNVYIIAFCIKFDNLRNFNNAFKLGNYNNNCVNVIFEDFRVKNNNLYFTGGFSGTVDFDPTANIVVISNTNPIGARFTLKLGSCNSSIPLANTNQIFCSSQNPTVANLSPNSSTIKWYDSATSTIQLSSTTPLTDGQIYYVASQVGSCPESQRLAVAVTINQSPLPPVATNLTFCADINATVLDLVANGQNLKWYSSLSETNSLPINTVLQDNTNYFVSQTVNGCESSRVMIKVTIIDVTQPSTTSPQMFCIQDNATINDLVVSGQNIKWYDSSIGGNLLNSTTTLSDGATYYVSQTVNGCESLRVPVSVQIQNTQPPTGSSNQSLCATALPTLNDILINGQNILWYTSSTSTVTLANTTPLVDGATYYATQTVNTCESILRTAVTVSLINTLNATNYSEIICDDNNDGFETLDLSSYNTNLIAATGNTFGYYNTLLNASNQTNAISNFTNYNASIGTHQIFVRIDSPNTCFQIVNLNLQIVQPPIIPINSINALCEGASITLNAGFGYDSYTWSTGNNTQNITITQPGNYSVTVTQNHGTIICSTSKIFTVVKSNKASISQVVTTDWTDINNVIEVLLTHTSLGNYTYSLDGIHYQTSNVFNNLTPGEYYVFVKDENGCGIVKEHVYLLNYPKFFTPNADGYNDIWKIKFSQFEEGFKVTIFDRYGKIIKSMGNKDFWDGTYNNELLPSDDYWFVVTRGNENIHKGHFTLKR